MEEGFQLLDNLVDWCSKHNVYVIIDMHGAPGGQTGANIDDSPNDQPELFTDKKNQDRLVDLWVKIASRYKDEPAVAGYDLLNEPLPQRTGAAAKYKDQLEPLYKRITAAIREVDKRHMITLEGCDWANDWSVFSTPFDDNLFYQFHYYCWDRPTQAQGHQPVPRPAQEAQCPGLGGRDRREGQRHLLGDDPVLRGQQHRLVVLAVEEDGDDEHAVLDQDAGRLGRHPRLHPEWDQALGRGGAKGLRSVDREHQARELRVLSRCGERDLSPRAGQGRGRELRPRGARTNPTSSRTPAQKSKYYRLSEPVPVEPIAGGNRQGAGQGIRLTDNEWTAYTIRSLAAKDYSPVMKAKAEGGPAVVELSVNGQTQDLVVDGTDWSEVPLKAAAFRTGTNRLKFLVKSRQHFSRLDRVPGASGPGTSEISDPGGCGPGGLGLGFVRRETQPPLGHRQSAGLALVADEEPRHTDDHDLHRGRSPATARTTKNLFLIDCPAAPGQDFQVTTCLVSFHPTDLWHQAGLILWNDEDNFLSLVYEWGEGPPELRLENQRMFTLGVEARGTPAFAWYYANQNLEKVWLRMTKRSNWFELSASEDGETFVPLSRCARGTAQSCPWATAWPGASACLPAMAPPGMQSRSRPPSISLRSRRWRQNPGRPGRTSFRTWSAGGRGSKASGTGISC